MESQLLIECWNLLSKISSRILFANFFLVGRAAPSFSKGQLVESALLLKQQEEYLQFLHLLLLYPTQFL